MTTKNNLPPWIEADLDKIGVRAPKPKKPATITTDHVPWTPTFDGEEPPF